MNVSIQIFIETHALLYFYDKTFIIISEVKTRINLFETNI